MPQLEPPANLSATAGPERVTLQWTAENLGLLGKEWFDIEDGKHPSGVVGVSSTPAT